MKQLTCIVCPNSCSLTVNTDTFDVVGAKCKRGIDFAKAELTNPTRSLTTSIKTIFPDCPVVSVKTNGEIPKDKIFDAMKLIAQTTLNKKVKINTVVIENILDTGVNVVTTSNM